MTPSSALGRRRGHHADGRPGSGRHRRHDRRGLSRRIRQILDAWQAGDAELAGQRYQQWLPLINYENRQGWLATSKVLMQAGGVIASDAVRHPLQPMQPATREGLLKIARRLDPLVLRWAR